MTNRIKHIAFMFIWLAAACMPLWMSAQLAQARGLDKTPEQIWEAWQAGMSDDETAAAVEQLKEEITRRNQVSSHPVKCEESGQAIADLLASEAAINIKIKQLGPIYIPLARSLEEKINGKFNQLLEQYETLKVDAARAGALISDADWAVYRQARHDKGGVSGAVLANNATVLADAGNPELLTQLKELKAREGRIALAMMDMSNGYKSGTGKAKNDAQKAVDKANKTWNKALKRYADLYRQQDEPEKKIRESFHDANHAYEHCLGEVNPKIKHGRGLHRIPGMNDDIYTLAGISEVYPAFAVPEAMPPMPPPLHFLKDPGDTVKLLAENAEAGLEGARAMMDAESVEAQRYFAEVASNYAPWKVAEMLINPLKKAADPALLNESTTYIAGEVFKGYTTDNVKALVESLLCCKFI